MFRLGQAGAVTAAAVIAVAAAVGTAVGAPVAVDSAADQQPGDTLYALERAGERIKEATFARGQDWDLERAQERLQEFKNTKEKTVSNNHEGLLNESQERLGKGIRVADDFEGLEKARNAVRNHVQVLENLENKVPEQAKPGIQRAIIRSQVQTRDVEEVQAEVQKEFGQGELPPGLLKQKMGGFMLLFISPFTFTHPPKTRFKSYPVNSPDENYLRNPSLQPDQSEKNISRVNF